MSKRTFWEWGVTALIVLGGIWLISTYAEWRDDRARAKAREDAGLMNYVHYRCESDCVEYRAGGDWAEARELIDGDDCPRNSSGFYQGCLAAVAWQLSVDALDRSAGLAGEEVAKYPTRPWREAEANGDL